MSSNLANRLNLDGQDVKSIVNGTDNTEVLHSQEADITVSSEIDESKIAFEISNYLGETPINGSKTFDVV